MILAAGLGTRLGALTQATPKALIDINGRPIIEHVARRLIAAGATHLVINVHHHADAIIEFVQSRSGFGVDVSFSREAEAPLETGGGLLHARPLFRGDGSYLVTGGAGGLGLFLAAVMASGATPGSSRAVCADCYG